MEKLRRWGNLLFLAVLLSGCIIIFRSNSVDSGVSKANEEKPIEVESPIKVHLNDGTTALFRSGATFTDSLITGDGVLYSLNLTDQQQINRISRSEVAAFEVFDSDVKPVPTFLVSAAVIGAAAAGTVFLFKAIFGSCPTIYTPSNSGMVLQSELFSNSIAPMLEKRDVTDIHAQPDDDGILQLEIRNEALETHYINHLELLEVTHKSGSKAVTDSDGKIYAISRFVDPVTAVNDNNKDVSRIISESDSLVFESNIQIAQQQPEVAWDYIDLEFLPISSEKGVLYFDLRNSLFSTVLLYDYFLALQGIESLDWLGYDLETVSGAVALGNFIHTFMGLRILQKIEGKYQEIGRISNTGPIAFREIAAPVNMIPDDTLKIRLKFLADSWRINKVKLATMVTEPEVRALPVSSIQNAEGKHTPKHLKLISKPDEKYIVTTPGDRFTVSFKTNPFRQDYEHSYFLAGQGYYIEWIRKKWIENNEVPTRLELSAELIIQAQKRWQKVKKDFERRFFESKIPVR